MSSVTVAAKESGDDAGGTSVFCAVSRGPLCLTLLNANGMADGGRKGGRVRKRTPGASSPLSDASNEKIGTGKLKASIRFMEK